MYSHVALEGRSSAYVRCDDPDEIDLRLREMLDALAWLERQPPKSFLPVLLEHASDRLMRLAVKARAEHAAR